MSSILDKISSVIDNRNLDKLEFNNKTKESYVLQTNEFITYIPENKVNSRNKFSIVNDNDLNFEIVKNNQIKYDIGKLKFNLNLDEINRKSPREIEALNTRRSYKDHNLFIKRNSEFNNFKSSSKTFLYLNQNKKSNNLFDDQNTEKLIDKIRQRINIPRKRSDKSDNLNTLNSYQQFKIKTKRESSFTERLENIAEKESNLNSDFDSEKKNFSPFTGKPKKKSLLTSRERKISKAIDNSSCELEKQSSKDFVKLTTDKPQSSSTLLQNEKNLTDSEQLSYLNKYNNLEAKSNVVDSKNQKEDDDDNKLLSFRHFTLKNRDFVFIHEKVEEGTNNDNSNSKQDSILNKDILFNKEFNKEEKIIGLDSTKIDLLKKENKTDKQNHNNIKIVKIKNNKASTVSDQMKLNFLGFDFLNLKYNVFLKEFMNACKENNTEEIYSSSIYYFNKLNKKEQSILLLSDKTLYILDSKTYYAILKYSYDKVEEISISTVNPNLLVFHIKKSQSDIIIEDFHRTDLLLYLKFIKYRSSNKVENENENEKNSNINLVEKNVKDGSNNKKRKESDLLSFISENRVNNTPSKLNTEEDLIENKKLKINLNYVKTIRCKSNNNYINITDSKVFDFINNAFETCQKYGFMLKLVKGFLNLTKRFEEKFVVLSNIGLIVFDDPKKQPIQYISLVGAEIKILGVRQKLNKFTSNAKESFSTYENLINRTPQQAINYSKYENKFRNELSQENNYICSFPDCKISYYHNSYNCMLNANLKNENQDVESIFSEKTNNSRNNTLEKDFKHDVCYQYKKNPDRLCIEITTPTEKYIFKAQSKYDADSWFRELTKFVISIEKRSKIAINEVIL